MLVLNHSLPRAVILPEAVCDLRTHLAGQGAHWFAALPEATTPSDAGAVRKLLSLTTDAQATRTRPNKNNSTLTETGLVFEAGIHCGFMLPEATPDIACWSCAIRFRAPDDAARTLMTLNPGNTDNYLFLQQNGGQLVFKDQQGTQEVIAATGAAGQCMTVIAGRSQDRLWLRVPGGKTGQTAPCPLDLTGPFTLFIGCRSNRGRLKKTLGHFFLQDFVFWPDRNILEPGNGPTLEALDTGALWRPAT